MPWKIICVVLAIALIAVSVAWAVTARQSCRAPVSREEATVDTAVTDVNSTPTSSDTQKKRKIIIDTDTGGDDAVALIIAAKDKNVDIMGVTVSEGNVSLDQAVKNALMTLEAAGCDAPVYAGADATYTGERREVFSVFGKDGMGDQDLIHPTRTAAKGNAVDFIIDTVKANPDEVEIMALGPVTNLALAFDKDPETMKRVKRYWSMGTSGFGCGNATPVAEFNVYHDAPAYKVFVESGVPITVLGFDMMDDHIKFTKDELDELAKKSDLAEFVAKAFSGLIAFNAEGNGKPVADDADGTLMACALWDGFMQETQACHAVVMTEDNAAYGQVILYKEGFAYDSGVTFDNYDFYVVTKIASETFKDRLLSVLVK